MKRVLEYDRKPSFSSCCRLQKLSCSMMLLIHSFLVFAEKDNVLQYVIFQKISKYFYFFATKYLTKSLIFDDYKTPREFLEKYSLNNIFQMHIVTSPLPVLKKSSITNVQKLVLQLSLIIHDSPCLNLDFLSYVNDLEINLTQISSNCNTLVIFLPKYVKTFSLKSFNNSTPIIIALITGGVGLTTFRFNIDDFIEWNSCVYSDFLKQHSKTLNTLRMDKKKLVDNEFSTFLYDDILSSMLPNLHTIVIEIYAFARKPIDWKNSFNFRKFTNLQKIVIKFQVYDRETLQIIDDPSIDDQGLFFAKLSRNQVETIQFESENVHIEKVFPKVRF